MPTKGARARLFVRTLDRLDQLRASRISEEVIREPFFSPDGEWIGFREGLTLKRISLQGGPAETIATLPAGTAGAHGIVWSADGTILVGAGQTGLVRVHAGSGEVETLITKERGILYPQALPDGKTLIYTESAGATSDGGEIALFDLASRTSRTLRPGSAARYLPSGHLVFVAGGTLWGMRFDIERLELRGTAVPLVTGVRVNPDVAVAQFALTDAGALAYLPVASSRRTLVWVDRQGKETPVGVPPRAYGFPRVSPDGTRIAVTIKDSDQDVHLWDVSRKVLRQLTFDPAANSTLSWLGNDRLAYSSQVAGWGQVFERRADGLGPARQVTSGLPSFPFAATPDGTILFVREYPPDSRWDIGVVPMQNPASRQTVERTTASENNPVLSPDGRWLTYQSNKTGRFEIYVRPFPLSGQGDIAITAEGGTRPVWARDGSELYYWTAGRSTVAIKSTRVTAGEPSSWGAPETVVEGPFVTSAFDTDYDVWDGRFLLMKDHADDGVLPAQEVVVVQNWIQELRRLVPGK